MTDDSLELLEGAGRAILVCASEPCAEEEIAAEHVEREVALVPVLTMEEATFLDTVCAVIRSVEVEDDLVGDLLMSVQEQVYEEALEGRWVV